MAIWAQGGQIPAWVASFGPLIVGTAVALYTIRAKNS
jgi:1,4-dihydroxy-2-naphthoate octaprenyltransferase